MWAPWQSFSDPWDSLTASERWPTCENSQGYPGRDRPDVQPEGDPGEDHDQDARHVHLDDVEAQVSLQDEIRPDTAEAASWKIRTLQV